MKEWGYLFEAIWILMIIKVHYRLLSFSRLLEKYPRKQYITCNDSKKILQVKKAIRRINKLPIGKNRCLVLSLVGRKMLDRRKIDSILIIGTQNNADAPDFGHAWLVSNGIEVVEHSIHHDRIAEF